MGTPPPPGWVETAGQLKIYGTVKLDANGKGAITVDPANARQRWVVTQVVVSTNQSSVATIVPQATLALNSTDIGTMSQGNQQGSTWSANQDTWTGVLEVGPCDFLSVLLYPPAGQSGSLAGVLCSAVIMGTKYTRRA